MHLVMAINEKVLESMAVNSNLIKDAGYLATCRKVLAEKHWLTVAASQEDPQFYLEVVSGAQRARKKEKDLN